MANYSKEFFDRFNRMSDEQLFGIIDSKAGQYTTEALDTARDIIEKRGGINVIKSNINEQKRLEKQAEENQLEFERKQKQEKEALRREKIRMREADGGN